MVNGALCCCVAACGQHRGMLGSASALTEAVPAGNANNFTTFADLRIETATEAGPLATPQLQHSTSLHLPSTCSACAAAAGHVHAHCTLDALLCPS